MKLSVGSIVVAACLSAATAQAQTATETEASFEKRVIETIIQNPEVVLVALQLLEAEKAEQARAASGASLEKFRDYLFPEGSNIRIVEFVDYNCGYCAASARDIKTLPASSADMISYIELPILGEASWEIARVALAVRDTAGQGAYKAFHHAIFENKGRVRDGRSALRLAAEMGYDESGIQAASQNSEIETELTRNRDMARELGIQGTPSFVTKDQVHEGIMTLSQLKLLTTTQGAQK